MFSKRDSLQRSITDLMRNYLLDFLLLLFKGYSLITWLCPIMLLKLFVSGSGELGYFIFILNSEWQNGVFQTLPRIIIGNLFAFDE